MSEDKPIMGVVHHVHERDGVKDDVIIERGNDGYFTAYLVDGKQFLTKCDTLDECKAVADKTLDARAGKALLVGILVLARDVDPEALREELARRLEGATQAELEAISASLLEARAAMSYADLVVGGMDAKLNIVAGGIGQVLEAIGPDVASKQVTIAALANKSFLMPRAAMIAAIDVEVDPADDEVLFQVKDLLSKGEIEAAHDLIERHDLWEEFGLATPSGAAMSNLGLYGAWHEAPYMMPFRWAFYKRFARRIADLLKTIIITEQMKQGDVYALVSIGFALAMQDKGFLKPEAAKKVHDAMVESLSPKGKAVQGKMGGKLRTLVKEMLDFIDANAVPKMRRASMANVAFSECMATAHLLPSPANIGLFDRRPLHVVLNEIKDKFYSSIELGMASLRKEYPTMSLKELDDAIEVILAREFRHRDVFSLPKLSADANRVVIKYKENIASVARQIYDYSKRRVLLGTWEQTLETLDFIKKMFIDALKATQTENILVSIGNPLLVASGIAPGELILVTIDDVEAEILKAFSSDLKALLGEMRAYGNVSNRDIFKAIESAINIEEFGKIADLIPRQKTVKDLKAIFGSRIKNLVKTIVVKAKQLVELYCKQNDKASCPLDVAFTCIRHVLVNVMEESMSFIDIVFNKWKANKQMATFLARQVDALKSDAHKLHIVGKVPSELETTWAVLMEIFKQNFAGVFPAGSKATEEERALVARYEPSFKSIFQAFVIDDLALVQDASTQGELVRALYKWVVGLTREMLAESLGQKVKKRWSR